MLSARIADLRCFQDTDSNRRCGCRVADGEMYQCPACQEDERERFLEIEAAQAELVCIFQDELMERLEGIL